MSLEHATRVFGFLLEQRSETVWSRSAGLHRRQAEPARYKRRLVPNAKRFCMTFVHLEQSFDEDSGISLTRFLNKVWASVAEACKTMLRIMHFAGSRSLTPDSKGPEVVASETTTHLTATSYEDADLQDYMDAANRIGDVSKAMCILNWFASVCLICVFFCIEDDDIADFVNYYGVVSCSVACIALLTGISIELVHFHYVGSQCVANGMNCPIYKVHDLVRRLDVHALLLAAQLLKATFVSSCADPASGFNILLFLHLLIGDVSLWLALTCLIELFFGFVSFRFLWRNAPEESAENTLWLDNAVEAVRRATGSESSSNSFHSAQSVEPGEEKIEAVARKPWPEVEIAEQAEDLMRRCKVQTGSR